MQMLERVVHCPTHGETPDVPLKSNKATVVT